MAEDALQRLAELLADSDTLIKAVATGRRRQAPSHRRVEIRYVDLSSGTHLQLTRYDDTQAHTSNHQVGSDAAAAIVALVREPFGNWHLDTTMESHHLRITKKDKAFWHASVRDQPAAVDRSHDQAKTRLLDADEPVLRALGISDSQGRIKPSRQAKYRQVEDFLRILVASIEDARSAKALPDGPLRIVDLGCGNAYLTFAAAALLGKSMPVELIGIDVKEQSREHNSRVAADLGLSNVSFVTSPIAAATLPQRPHVVLALHACDTATDDCIARALEWEAPLILAAPCCHKDISRQLRKATVPDVYQPLVRDGILRERFADTLTDAIRASLLRERGYRVDVIEFVDSAHTPRNSLIRAVRTGHRQDDGAAEIVAQLGLRPKLGELLG